MSHKQVIVIRKDLKMRRGKEISQGCHASMGAILKAGEYVDTDKFELVLDEDIGPWLKGSFTKITVSVNSEAELDKLEQAANEAGILNYLITDNGFTEFHGVKTKTCLAIGPAPNEKIDSICKHLPLY